MTLDRASGGLPLISAAVVLGIAIISLDITFLLTKYFGQRFHKTD